jgi:hypothetical protein
MPLDEMNRRDFHKLSAAALAGMIAGTTIGCGEDKPQSGSPTAEGSKAAPKSPPPAEKEVAKSDSKAKPVAAAAVAMHACRGLNECKGQGRDKKNACAGRGSCYTVTHDCSGKNDCKNQGGCGGTNGFNDCKGKGGCGHFPIGEDDVWKKARDAFESRMKVAGKSIGPAPAAAKG